MDPFIESRSEKPIAKEPEVLANAPAAALEQAPGA
jgi:hypothetical protein